VAHHEPFRAHPVLIAATRCDPHFLDPQVVGDVVVAAGAGQRRGGLGAGVAQLLGVDVVPATAGEVGAVGGGGESGVGGTGVFSSMDNTTAPPGGSMYRPTMSATFSANRGSRLSLNVPCR
jgi:hypothetical protein